MKKTLIFGLLLSAAAVVAQPKMGDRAELEKKKEKIEKSEKRCKESMDIAQLNDIVSLTDTTHSSENDPEYAMNREKS